jgi:hypothetical protein
MGQALLVSVDIPMGAKILRALDEAGLNVKVAAWMVLPEYEDWRLILASPTFDKAGIREGYGIINKALDAAEIPFALQPVFMTLPMTDPTIRDLRRTYRKEKDIEGRRIGGHMIGDRFVEDGYAYRIS